MIKHRAVIFANGEIADLSAITQILRPDDFLIAVDGGLKYLGQLNKTPHLLIGDLDSAMPFEVQQLEHQSVEIQRFPVEKDETDLELALLAAVKRGYQEIVLVGALGGRLDHTLANLFLLMLPQLTEVNVTIESVTEEISLIRKSKIIHGQVGDIVSLLPLNGIVSGVQTSGLKYPLRNETLFMQKSRGISNMMLTGEAEISLDSGCLLCIHTRTTILEE